MIFEAIRVGQSLKQTLLDKQIQELLLLMEHYRVHEAYEILFRDFLPKLSGDPWKGLDT